MQKVFAEVGQSLQQIGGDCPDGWIEMSEQRPDASSIAQADGTWASPPPVYRQMSSLDFLRLFDPERRAIKQAAMQDVDVGIWYDDTVAAQFVTYSDPRVEAGLAALVDAGLLTAERKTEIVARMTGQEI
ncbi:hypothetical protein [Comamonas jiangduensis]|uniref:hypothetical protein n=1 Tax=Comamonas jiangduensis TaxID=1194168 RepID=UPI003BF8688C